MDFYYVYMLQSELDDQRYYVGFTEDLKKRLLKHNNKDVAHTKKFAPWKIQTALAFDSKDKAIQFEKYLKSHSGRAFAKKHF